MRQRRHVAELMDDPALDGDAHRGALDALRRINTLSGSARIFAGPIRDLAARTGEPLRVLDIATGGGDVAAWLKTEMPQLDVHACDVSPRAIEYAKSNEADITWFVADALRDQLPDDFDVVMCSLFLHHLSDADAVALLTHMAKAARRMVLVNDLRRGLGGVVLTAIGTRVLTRSRVVRVDGMRSVGASFTIAEARQLALRAGLDGVRVERRFPWRWLLQWERR